MPMQTWGVLATRPKACLTGRYTSIFPRGRMGLRPSARRRLPIQAIKPMTPSSLQKWRKKRTTNLYLPKSMQIPGIAVSLFYTHSHQKIITATLKTTCLFANIFPGPRLINLSSTGPSGYDAAHPWKTTGNGLPSPLFFIFLSP